MYYTKELKKKVVLDALEGMDPREIKRKYGYEGDKNFVKNYKTWIKIYKLKGLGSLKDSKVKNKYSEAIKSKVVKAYLGGIKPIDISRKWLNGEHQDINLIKFWVKQSKESKPLAKKVGHDNISKIYKKMDIEFNSSTRKYIGLLIPRLAIEDKRKIAKVCYENRKYKITTLSSILKEFGLKKSTYYYEPNRKNTLDKDLIEKISKIYYKSKCVYGRKRIKMQLNRKYGIDLNEKTIYKYMKHLKIKSIIRKPKIQREKKVGWGFPNIIRRDFKASRPFEKLFMDTSYIRTIKGNCYLSAIIDVYNNKIVAYSFGKSMGVPLAIKCLSQLKGKSNFILHTDHGFEFVAPEFVEFAKKMKITQSMSRLGNSLDNRPIEYFFSIIKSEWLNVISSNRMTFEEVSIEIDKFMDWYNNKRGQLCLGGKTPSEF